MVLLSGGMDSAVAAAWTRARGHPWIALTVDYGQRHSAELAAAAEIARRLGAVETVRLAVDLRAVGGSALTGALDVPKGGAGGGGIPPTYVPARNTLLLALGLGLAEARGATLLVLGANRIDYSGYPDCRPAFLEAFQALACVATKAGIEGRAPQLLAPLLHCSKAEIVRMGRSLGVPFECTLSCYDPDLDGRACGACDSCRLRARGFSEAGLPDPAAPPERGNRAN